MSGLMVGDLVCSSNFSGIGKLLSVDHKSNEGVVGFFESPINSECRLKTVDVALLESVQLYEESIVYCQDRASGIWRRGRYAGPRPGNRHLVIFRADGDQQEVDIDQLNCLNIGPGELLDPAAFLAARSNDAPYFCSLRHDFLNAYIEQRAACRSISSIPSSSVELEPHQIAVVRRVLQDPTPKYLLADEVGLGKTIEAGMIIREHVLENKHDSRVLITVPAALIEQWRDELSGRFHLSELLASQAEPQRLIRICSHEHVNSVLKGWLPTLLVVDEAHQIAPWAWDQQSAVRERFCALAEGCQVASVVLLLSGTPLNGNEKNFLAMLHCLSPEAYELSEEGVRRFTTQIAERELVGGWYSALTPSNSNAALEQILQNLVSKFPDDQSLQSLVNEALPLVDFFAEQSGDLRMQAVKTIRRYIGEHYRLHQRMLRNRRESQQLAWLFPGLAGLKRSYWPLTEQMSSLDLLLEEYRSQASRDPDDFQAMNAEVYLQWIDDLLVSPLLVGRRANQAIQRLSGSLKQAEQELLDDISQQALHEQVAKDNCLVGNVRNWLAEHKNGKAVVFCSVEDVAQHIFTLLACELDVAVERYIPGRELRFIRPVSSIRVLVCDQRGEDGLNLHGGQRVAVHYSLPRSLSRIEQRLGRLNRYSANLVGVRPVESLALLPAHDGLIRRWIDVLDLSVGLFNNTIASLQYVLEEHLERTWKTVASSGDEALLRSAAGLSGDDGLLVRERRRVRVQEELLALDDEVSEAKDFAEQIADADDSAEEQAKRMCAWMTKGLHFNFKGDLQSPFRLRFAVEGSREGAKTLVDVQTFVATCLTGIDPDSGNPPATAPMSVSRTQVAGQSGVYPFRYGQPFVDSIYNLITVDSRGATSAFLRVLEKGSLSAPKVFFRLNWLVTATKLGASRLEQLRGDEKLMPSVRSHWLAEDGGLVVAESMLRSLEWPYDKANPSFQDFNLRSNVWPEFESLLPAEHWKRMTLEIASRSRQQILADLPRAQIFSSEPQLHLLSMHAVVVCTNKMLKGA
ncbi:protein DpdE [Pseudomonas sp. GL-B-16]|uniref:protein DpdE n=1 Tax=Pseudomonas sp. GL-B-16 TaxID=2832373 RepID=UPI001CBCB537|nr:protein DpdE [Pseudomonas sp. GL-B-16]